MANHKLILKNTIFLAVRMILSLGVTLYTSRVVLQQLGVEDFGIYSVVAGLVTIVAFIKSALTVAMQRYMNVELALTHGKNLQTVFAASFGCIFVLILLFIVLAEVVGLWYLNHELNIPLYRMEDARVVFQMSLVIVIVEMLRIPYNSLIIAHEKMSFYAYNSIFEVLLKLAVAISLIVIAGDKLVVYMWLLITVAFLVNVSYIIYCRKILPAIHFSMDINRKKMKEIGKFAGWNVLTSFSDISYQQGSAMILNVFFGVAYNATMGIANQIKSAVFSFTGSVQSASNPQIIQSFASGKHEDFTALFINVSRISFYCVAFLGVPVLLNSEWLLSVWLVDIPPLAPLFAQLMIGFCMIDALVGPLWVTMQASGKVARYNIIVSIIWLMCLPITYLVYKLGLPVYSLIVVMSLTDLVLIVIRVKFTQKNCNIPSKLYYKKVIFNVLTVLIVSISFPMAIKLLTYDKGFYTFILTTGLWVVSFPVSVYFLGFDKNERNVVKKLFKR